MTNIWDYLMRRKLLLLVLIAIFVTGYVLASLFLSAPMNQKKTVDPPSVSEISERPQPVPVERLIIPIVNPDSPDAILTEEIPSHEEEIAINIPLTGDLNQQDESSINNVVASETLLPARQLATWQDIVSSTTLILMVTAFTVAGLHFLFGVRRIKP